MSVFQLTPRSSKLRVSDSYVPVYAPLHFLDFESPWGNLKSRQLLLARFTRIAAYAPLRVLVLEAFETT